jgi:hypothetical protein
MIGREQTRMKRYLLQTLWSLAVTLAAAVPLYPQPLDSKSPDPGQSAIAKRYGDSARKIIAAALEDTDGLTRLEYLCDRIGSADRLRWIAPLNGPRPR